MYIKYILIYCFVEIPSSFKIQPTLKKNYIIEIYLFLNENHDIILSY